MQLNAEPSLGHAGETFLLLSLGKLLGIGVACIPTDKNMLYFFSSGNRNQEKMMSVVFNAPVC